MQPLVLKEPQMNRDKELIQRYKMALLAIRICAEKSSTNSTIIAIAKEALMEQECQNT